MLKNWQLGLSVVAVSLLYIYSFNLLRSPNFLPSRTQPEQLVAAEDKKGLSYEEALNKSVIKQPSGILEVELYYDELNEPKVSIEKVKHKKGYAPTYVVEKSEYNLQLLDSNDSVLLTQPIQIPNELFGPPPKDKKETPGNEHIKLKQTPFIITLPKVEGTEKVRLVTAWEQVLDTRPAPAQLESLQQDNPSFSTIPGESLVNPQSDDLVPLGGGGLSYLDITFISSGYSVDQMNRFHDDVYRLANKLVTVEPFKSRAHQLVFHYFDNTQDIGCSQSDRMLHCDSVRTLEILNNNQVIYDVAAVIVNTELYGGTGGSRWVVTYNGLQGGEVFVHEFGHALDLADEYTYDESVDSAINNRVEINCYSGKPPAAEWVNIVGFRDYALGCTNRNWYRSSPVSLMIDYSGFYFNAVSQIHMNSVLDGYTSPYEDTINPAANLQLPTLTNLLSSTVNLQPTVSDDKGIAYVQLWVDNHPVQTVYESPYQIDWKTTRHSNGEHTVQVKAVDAKNNKGQSSTLPVIINNSADTTNPVVNLVTPIDGDIVTNSTWMYATANDDTDLIHVEFYVDDKIIFSNDDGRGWYYSFWNTRDYDPGVHTIIVKAYDWAGNIATATGNITLKIDDPEPPYVYLLYPKEVNISQGNIWLNADAYDNVRIAKVEFYVDNSLYDSDNAYPYEAIWDTKSYIAGSQHTVYAKAYDSVGNSTASQTNTYKVANEDIVPPQSIIDLKVDSTTSTGASMSWTAPGDDGNLGRIWKYDIRYSKSPINESNWSTVQNLGWVEDVVLGGSKQTLTLYYLEPNTEYYTAIKTLDDASNISGLSNVVTFTTIDSTSVYDLDNNGVLDDQDYELFKQQYLSHKTTLDFIPDSVVNVLDFSIFKKAFDSE